MGKSIKDILVERYENNRLKKPDLIKESTHSNIPETQKRPSLIRLSKITLSEWGFIVGVLAFAISLWMYIIQPIINANLK